MSKKSKKIIISLSVVIAIIGTLIALSFTVFSLKKVSINYKTSHSQIELSDQEIIDGGQFAFGSSVFFHSKNDYVMRIENLSPYIDVVNIETVFPSSFVVHIAQRSEVYAFEYDEKTFIVDQNLRILKVQSDFVSEQSNAMLITGATIYENDYKEGDYLGVSNFCDLYTSFFECNRTLNQQTSLIKQIDFKMEYDEVVNQNQLTASISLFSGQTVQIKNCEYGLKYKVNLFLSVYSQLYSLIGKQISDSESVWTEQLLDNCTIIINNYYNYTEHSQSDCYFNILPNF